MGQVFKARHGKMGRTVAVKVLPRDKSTPEAVASFTREIRALARLDHPKLVARARRRPGRKRPLPGHRIRARHGPAEAGPAARAAGRPDRRLDHLAGGRRVGIRPRPGNHPPRREAGQRAGFAGGRGEALRPGALPARWSGGRKTIPAMARSRARPIIFRPIRSATRGIPRRPGTSTRWAARSITR